MPILSYRTVKDIANIELAHVFPAAPPGWVRLEPQSVTGDPAPGLASRIHDPFWLLSRQWQFAEFAGEDAGTPLTCEINSSAKRIDLLASPSGKALRIESDDMLDPMIERESASAEGPGLRPRAEAGEILAAALEEAGHTDIAGLRSACHSPVDIDTTALGVGMSALVARAIDGEAAAIALEQETPAWLASAAAPILAAADDWLAWYRTNVSPRFESDYWIRSKLEYGFSVAAGDGAEQVTLQAKAHAGGEIDWHSFTLDPTATAMKRPRKKLRHPQKLDFPRELKFLAKTSSRTLVSPLTYNGMPADRLWEFEDRVANFGSMDVEANDVARLCLIEFAMVYGCDWFVTPLAVQRGSIAEVETLKVLDDFGVSVKIDPAPVGPKGQRFAMFSVADSKAEARLNGLVTPHAAFQTVEGPPLERVDFFRDEGANMAWAIELAVQDPAGDTISRRPNSPLHQPPEQLPETELLYTLQSSVAPNWLPLVPIPTDPRNGGFVLRKGTMTGTDDARGRLLSGLNVDFNDEEIPPEGLSVVRVPCIARLPSGQRVRWIARRCRPSLGSVNGGLAFDTAERAT